MTMVRYIVLEVDASVAFYTGLLGFALTRQYGPAMALVTSGDLTLLLAGPAASASRPMPDGAQPVPGGWNRIVIEVENLQTTVTRLRTAGASYRNETVSGPGGQQILLNDPSGNLIELFQPA